MWHPSPVYLLPSDATSLNPQLVPALFEERGFPDISSLGNFLLINSGKLAYLYAQACIVRHEAAFLMSGEADFLLLNLRW